MGRRAKVNAKKRNRRIVQICIVVAIVAVVVVLAFVVEATSNVAGDQYSTYIGQSVSVFPTVMQDIAGVNDSTLNAVGLPSSVSPPSSISGTTLTENGKPEILYIGGEFCPFCAVERWSMLVALSRFGNFTGLQLMQSSSTDVNPNTPTFSFQNSTYTSSYIAFNPVEEFNRQTETITTLTSETSSLYSQYGTCSASGESGIPFIDIANQYVVNCGAQFEAGTGSSADIAGDNWTQVASQLNTSTSPVAQVIDGAANSLITAICKVDGSQPSSVCSQNYADVTLSYENSASSSPSSNQQLLSLIPQSRDEPRWTD